MAGPGHQREDERCAAGDPERSDVLKHAHVIECYVDDAICDQPQLKWS
jgi:hypothetical protein